MGFIALEHVGIAVTDLDQANKLFHLLSETKHYKIEQVESERVNTSFFKIGNTKIEFVAGQGTENAISKFIEKKGPGIHHLAFEVADIIAEMNRLREAGFDLLNEQPKKGADNKLVCFIHPKSAGGILVELTQEIKSV